MENATKALLIAASVLVAILIIAFGIRIFNSTKGVPDSVENVGNSSEAAIYNSQFTPYFGVQTAEKTREFISVLQASNSKTNNKTHFTFIQATGNHSGVPLYQLASNIDDSKQYKIEPTETDKNNYITKIGITEQQ